MNSRILPTLAATLALLTTTAQASVTFQTPGTPDVNTTVATLYGSIQTSGESASTVFFEYGTTLSYGSATTPFINSVAANSSGSGSAFISGLQANTTYHYRYVATGQTSGVVIGTSDYTFTTAPASVAAPNPPSARPSLVAVGGSVTLDLNVTGTLPITSQWKHNGVLFGSPLTGTGVAIQLNPVVAGNAGAWACSFSNSVPSSAESSAVTLTVAGITTFPATKAAVQGGTITATVTLLPAGTSATYSWFISGNSSLTGIGSVSGQGTNTLTVSGVTPAADATYQCLVTVGGSTVTLNTGRAIIALTPTIASISAQTLRVGEPANIAVNVTANTATAATTVAKGLPAGLVYSSATGTITGACYAPTPLDDPLAITVQSTNANGTSTLAFPLTVNALDPDAVGGFTAFIPRDADSKGLGGRLTLQSTAVGAVTGSITLGTAVYPINAKLAGNAGLQAELKIPALASGANPKLDIDLTLGSDSVSGTIVGPAGTAHPSGSRSSWNLYDPVPVPGVFNCYLTPGGTQLASALFPHGNSIASLTISSLGAVTCSGRMADGTAYTASSTLSDGGDVPLFASLYSGNGSVLGSLTVNNHSVSNSLNWLKLAAAAGRAYAAGFAAHDLTCTGYRYVKPNAVLGQIFIGLAAGANNARLNFTDSSLSKSISQVFTVSALSVPALPPGFTMTLNAGTGMINGTFAVTDPNPIATGSITRTGAYYAIAVPGSSPVNAYGFFTLPNLPAVGAPSITTNPVTSGVAGMAP